ncbi:DNA polymerase III subunit gamma/tau [Virgibacillus sp. 179-BFC.A HS]|uniref:DNA-directed DNA polymerase n=1 Tax=Tigheibacillus jepli TaxID=3035914 RepID=A0ABU5CD04_9BACI|nr:DNA polymerase III subunit gamma/tau [Virgibacillus sp. 179-BFC.A HS]MDY0404090.1 DNA polymerase III subunit gamma/tau [Virgibacillus sp. 179-BFC.A HS]
MSYQALYRKWRPQQFADVAGQQHITRTLQNAMVQGKFSHAYLFTGPRGTGKTSAAKIFAKAINCEHQPAKEPCNECAACRGIQDGSISDVIEIDAASNTSVEDIREIRDKVKYAPSAVPYKVYIIDEVHMISTSAFNALLKTLEEPPKHVVFILATTEPHKIPLTIISRCQRFDFKPIANQAIVSRMQHIVKAEDIQVSQEALDAVALAAEGGMRDALSILDQAISYSDVRVELADVLAVTGGVSQQILTNIADAMYEKDMEQALQLLDELIQNGKDPGRFVYDMIYFLRDVLLYKSAPNLVDILERAMLDDAFKALAEKLPNHWIQDAIMRLNECQQEIKWTNNPKVFIEITIISITNRYHPSENQESNMDETEIIQLKTKLSELENEIDKLKQAPAPAREQTPAEPRRRPARQSKNSYKIPYEKIRMCLQDAQKQALKQVLGEWANFLGKLKSQSAPAHATIQDSKPVAASDNAVVVAFKYEIHCSLFMENRQMVESVLASTIQKQLTIIPIPINDWKTVRSEYVKDHETTSEQSSQKEEDPFIAEARKLVGDDLLEIHD